MEDIHPSIHPFLSHLPWSAWQRQTGWAERPAFVSPRNMLFHDNPKFASRIDGMWNPSDMLWACLGFPFSLPCPELFQREDPRHLSSLLSEELVACYHRQASQITELLTRKCKVRLAATSHLILSPLPRILHGDDADQWADGLHLQVIIWLLTPWAWSSAAQISDAGTLSCVLTPDEAKERGWV